MTEFSRPVDIARLGDAEAVHDIEATAPERRALAERLGIVAVGMLRAHVAIRRIRGGTAVRLSGYLAADVTQSCVVTLDPVENHLEEEFTILYAADTSSDESALGPDTDISWPEPLPDGPLDIGEAVAQQLSLALDPYPRAAGIEPDRQWSSESAGSQNPFAGLAALRKLPRSSG
jgi:uncharacterized metal-binding protein YceD (DUF177 family)